MNSKSLISIIIPNLNSLIIDKTIDSLIRQTTERPFEIIVVGQDKWNLVEKYSEVQFIETSTPVNAAKARNIGINEAKGEWLLFIDSDCVASEKWIDALLSPKNKDWKVIGGGVKSPDESYWQMVYNLSMFHAYLASQPRSETRFLPTLNLAVHRSVIETSGLLDEDLVRGQDVDWTIRMNKAGHALLFDPTAYITHHPARKDLLTLKKFFRNSGYYMIQVRYRYPDIFNMSPLLMKHPSFWRTFSDPIALWTTIKIYLKSKEVQRHMRAFWHINLLKKSWCLGAAEGIESMQENG
jgi:glycosyltransferase involved in cell wall biosynthesis